MACDRARRIWLRVGSAPGIARFKQRDLVCVLAHKKVLSVELWIVVHRDLVRSAQIRATMDFLSKRPCTIAPGAVVSCPQGQSSYRWAPRSAKD